MRILVVEDDLQIAAFIAEGLTQAGFAVDASGNGEEGLHMALTTPYDVAVIDLMLPAMDGLRLIDTIRRRGLKSPVLILSAKRSVDDRVRGLQTGGDDYLTKPFAFAELVARVQALIRRASGIVDPTSLTVGGLSLDILSREVWRDGTRIDLQPREFALLEYLMRYAGRVVSKTMLFEHIWDYRFDPQTNVVDVLVCRVRHKIERDYPTKFIQTIRGVGYVLKVS